MAKTKTATAKAEAPAKKGAAPKGGLEQRVESSEKTISALCADVNDLSTSPQTLNINKPE